LFQVIDVSEKESKKEIVVKVEAIETPRGLVPSIKALESIVNMINEVLSNISSSIQNVALLLKENAEVMKNILRLIQTIDVKLDVIQEMLTDIRASMKKEESSVVYSEEPKKDIKRDLLDMIKSGE